MRLFGKLLAGLIATLLLLAAQGNAQVRGAVRFSARQNAQGRYVQRGVASPAIQTRFQVAYGGNGFATPAVGGTNGYATPAVGGGNGYATPAVGGGNGYAVPAPVVDPNEMCDAKWRIALRREIMNVGDWQCATRTVSGSTQPCVITGPTAGSTFKNISACGWKMPTFCDNTVADLMATTLKQNKTSKATIPSDYTLVAGAGYYKVHTESLTWDAAQAACAAEAPGSHLAIPSTATDYQAINDMINAALPSQTAGAFIGINDIEVENTFVTVTGQPICMLGQVIFQSGQPDNFGNEDCLEIGYQKGAFLNDIPCNKPLPFVCELPLPGSTIC